MVDPLAAPLRMHPRLDLKPWGGRRLEHLGLTLPEAEPVGEALATANETTVADGPLAGLTLRELISIDPAGVLGTRGLEVTGNRPRFPLLIKLIDAHQDLSIQVHPNDAAAPEGNLGKTEVYHVLGSGPNAAIALGFRSGVTLAAFASACHADKGVESLLRWLPAQPGETILIPAGTVHALGGGCLVYEAQQPSDVTYRLSDWGRVDASGQPRELHLDAGLAVVDPALRPNRISPLRLQTNGVSTRQLLAACRYFALEQISLQPGECVIVRSLGSSQTVTCLQGGVTLATGSGVIALAAGETGIMAASAREEVLRAVTPALALHAWVPDLFTEIVVPAREAGHAEARIASLAGPLPDLKEMLGPDASGG